MTAAQQITRLLTLVPMVNAKGGMALADAAEALGTTTEQVRKDLSVLFMCGLPGGMPDDLIDVNVGALATEDGDGETIPDAVIEVGNAEYLQRPVRLSPREQIAFTLALQVTRDAADPEAREVLDSALAKVQGAATAAVGRFAPGAAPTAAASPEAGPHATAVQRAIDANHQLRIRYYTPARDAEMERTIDPFSIFSKAGVSYLDAYCHTAEAHRFFRLDRIRELDELTSPITAQPAAHHDLDEDFFTRDEGLDQARLRLGPGALWVAEYYPVSSVSDVDENTREVTLPVTDAWWLTRLLLSVGADAVVLEPGHLVDHLVTEASTTLALYAEDV